MSEVWAEVENCDGCDYGPVLATEVRRSVRQEGQPEVFHFCRFCYEGWTGNAAIYRTLPDYQHDARLLKHISTCFNVLLEVLGDIVEDAVVDARKRRKKK